MWRKLYDWVLNWAKTPYSSWALFFLAFCESSFFPIPPDVLLIVLCVAIPLKAFKYAAICSLGSIVGGCFGYMIGFELMAQIGYKILTLYNFIEKFDYIKNLYTQYDAWVISIAGFTPLPYKLFTISAGAFRVNFTKFLFASLISRSLRFFLVASLIFAFGPKIQTFIDRHFNILSVIFTILLISGFVLIKFIF